MPITVLLADDSPVMLIAMRRTLAEDSRINIVGEAASFTETMQKLAEVKPDFLLLDLTMPEKGDFTPPFVRSQLASVPYTLAVSFSNDAEARALAESYGAIALLDKMNLYGELIPTIMCCAVERHLQKELYIPNRARESD
jgi:DNA-binding NarL/FixJ family response regulator